MTGYLSESLKFLANEIFLYFLYFRYTHGIKDVISSEQPTKCSRSYYCFLKLRVNSNVLFWNCIFFSINLKQIICLNNLNKLLLLNKTRRKFYCYRRAKIGYIECVIPFTASPRLGKI